MPKIQRKEEILESWLFDNCPHKSGSEGSFLLKIYCKGGKENGPDGQTQGALTGRHHYVMALVSQASRNYINFAKL